MLRLRQEHDQTMHDLEVQLYQAKVRLDESRSMVDLYSDMAEDPRHVSEEIAKLEATASAQFEAERAQAVATTASERQAAATRLEAIAIERKDAEAAMVSAVGT